MVKNVSEKITLEEALSKHLGPCKICKPGNIAANSLSNPVKIAKGEKNTVQCKGVTKTGARCKHMTSIADGYCYQHRPR